MRSDDATTLGDVAFNLALQHIRDKGMPHMAEAVRDICVENETLHARIATLAAEVERVKATYNTMVKGYEAQLATARADALREVREEVLRLYRLTSGGDFAAVLAILDATRGET